MGKKTKKRKIKFRGILVIILFIYLIGSFFAYIINLKIKNIYINGTNLIKDYEIIEIANLKKYPSILKLNKDKTCAKIKKISLINSCKIKKSITGKLTINIEEAKPLFINRSIGKVILSNKKEVDSKQFTNIPILINIVPERIYNKLITALTKINSDTISLISEIEYNPDIKDDVILDEERFYLRMNDKNRVYINIINIERLNNYMNIYSTLESGVTGTLSLDSANSDNTIFKKD